MDTAEKSRKKPIYTDDGDKKYCDNNFEASDKKK
jgi:hypothetical protein